MPRDIEREQKLRQVMNRYIGRFGEDQVLYLFTAPPEYQNTDKLIALYEKCLAEDKPVSAFVDVSIDPEALY